MTRASVVLFLLLAGCGGVTASDPTGAGATLVTDPGTHEVSVSVRPCSGNCDHLDPVFDTCSGTYDLRGGKSRAVVHLRASEGCTIETAG